MSLMWAGLNTPMTRRCYLPNVTFFLGRPFIGVVLLKLIDLLTEGCISKMDEHYLIFL